MKQQASHQYTAEIGLELSTLMSRIFDRVEVGPDEQSKSSSEVGEGRVITSKQVDWEEEDRRLVESARRHFTSVVDSKDVQKDIRKIVNPPHSTSRSGGSMSMSGSVVSEYLVPTFKPEDSVVYRDQTIRLEESRLKRG